MDPKDPEVWSNRGAALGSLGRYDEALAFFEKAIDLEPDC
jgi:Flp pilus assembly protein TadD